MYEKIFNEKSVEPNKTIGWQKCFCVKKDKSAFESFEVSWTMVKMRWNNLWGNCNEKWQKNGKITKLLCRWNPVTRLRVNSKAKRAKNQSLYKKLVINHVWNGGNDLERETSYCTVLENKKTHSSKAFQTEIGAITCHRTQNTIIKIFLSKNNWWLLLLLLLFC